MNHALLIRTAARWKIPRELAEAVLVRDQLCVYCKRPFEEPSGQKARWRSWEHIVNDLSIITEENIALCCVGCNASKGTKNLATWLGTKYCLTHGITNCSLAPVARRALDKTEMR